MEKKDYKSLIGKTVKYHYRSGKVVTGIVVGVDSKIGLTIVNENNPDHYLVCLNGPNSPKRNTFSPKFLALHRELFDHVIKAIQKGDISVKNLFDINLKYHIFPGTDPNGSNCAFS